ncbi:MAG TPA: hypothetical protein IGS17_00965 [Oscillatoriales cyanobacterium M59_W2019_021]|nr:MAG: hypothetical protein D6728_12130 [Cyanobacteria bacterium J055]HIK31997.1 hypothetical protein [Oscillatoriales cyanobacterium M4454_W2019_049]HIK49485.1 hypothetical protein [Oscillatoriales cyanobacterium M59_W2019_021]
MAERQETGSTATDRQHLCCPGLPLAVYREVAAHLRQVDGVDTALTEQSSEQFDYAHSQVGALLIQYPPHADEKLRERVDRILAYYGDRYGEWLVVGG